MLDAIQTAPGTRRPEQQREDSARQQKIEFGRRKKERSAAGAGEGIRTLDPNLGKVVLYP